MFRFDNRSDMGNASTRGNLVEQCSAYDETTINRGTLDRPKPLLKFHSVHGENVQLLNDGRMARRKESFCKALAFSNRPIAVDEIVCLSLCEVGTSWSGVLRFGVTNVDPASFRDIELPKFVCPDLTSKHGYWAKALAERYSTDKAILHFFVNADGELHYGVNGVSKGLFLTGINVDAPLWIVVDIYGNSVGVEFMDPCVVELRSLSKVLRAQRPSPARESRRPNSTTLITPVSVGNLGDELTRPSTMTASTSAANLTTTGIAEHDRASSARNSPFDAPLHFHSVKGANISLVCNDLVAVRRHGEYNLGYVFTDRPLRADEVISVVVLQSEEAFSGSLTFGLTSCDPVNVAASRLPVDSDDLLERGEYWVCIKDVGAQPLTGDRLTFRVDAEGKVHFAKNNATPKVIMHVDMTVRLWAFFDLYGTTAQVVMDNEFLQQFNGVSPTSSTTNAETRSHRASSEGVSIGIFAATSTANTASTGALPTMASAGRPSTGRLDNPAFWDRLLVALPPTTTTTSAANEPARGNISHIGSSSEDNLRAQTQPRFITLPGLIGPEAGDSSMSSSASSSGHDVDIAAQDSSLSARIRPTGSSRHRFNNYLNRVRPITTAPQTTNPSSEMSTTSRPSVTATSTSTAGVAPSGGFSLLGDDFDLMAARYSSMLSRRRGQGPSYSASPDPSTVRLSTTVTSTSPSTSAYATPSATPTAYGSVLREALQCLNDAASSSYRNPASTSSLFATIPNTSSGVKSSTISGLSHTVSAPFTRPADTVKDEATDAVKDPVDGSECLICMNNRINAVIYRCGHMCMCFPCAKELNRRSGDCPICRTPIIDVIRCYPA